MGRNFQSSRVERRNCNNVDLAGDQSAEKRSGMTKTNEIMSAL